MNYVHTFTCPTAECGQVVTFEPGEREATCEECGANWYVGIDDDPDGFFIYDMTDLNTPVASVDPDMRKL